jgi:hypothetical protein
MPSCLVLVGAPIPSIFSSSQDTDNVLPDFACSMAALRSATVAGSSSLELTRGWTCAATDEALLDLP